MKTTLWMIIALVTGIVGFLLGYSVSGFTGSRQAAAIAGHAGPQPAAGDHGAPRPEAGGYATTAAPAPRPEAGGPATTAAPAPKPEAGGYGATAKPAAATKVADGEKPKAAGY